jgi:hypothetical protein
MRFGRPDTSRWFSVTHRAYESKARDIQIALDIIEGIMAAIFVHADAAKKVSERVPARPKTPSP